MTGYRVREIEPAVLKIEEVTTDASLLMRTSPPTQIIYFVSYEAPKRQIWDLIPRGLGTADLLTIQPHVISNTNILLLLMTT
jgi:hypothetical protein